MFDLEAHPSGPRWCKCVATHCPMQLPSEAEGHHIWPLGEGGPDVEVNMRWLCPTTHSKVHNLWRAYKEAGGKPGKEIVGMYSKYVRELVDNGWRQKEAGKIPL